MTVSWVAVWVANGSVVCGLVVLTAQQSMRVSLSIVTLALELTFALLTLSNQELRSKAA